MELARCLYLYHSHQVLVEENDYPNLWEGIKGLKAVATQRWFDGHPPLDPSTPVLRAALKRDVDGLPCCIIHFYPNLRLMHRLSLDVFVNMSPRLGRGRIRASIVK